MTSSLLSSVIMLLRKKAKSKTNKLHKPNSRDNMLWLMNIDFKHSDQPESNNYKGNEVDKNNKERT